jgi:hypothetical protein
MKTFLFGLLSCLAVVFVLVCAGCGRVLSDEGYILELPALPAEWERLLGAAHWRIEYADSSGKKAVKMLSPGEKTILELPQTITSAVLACPFWPLRGISAGTFKPAGALFPYDAQVFASGGGSISASWRSGVDAFLYWELARAAAGDIAAIEAKTPRIPTNFNWPRFRELLAGDELKEEIRSDPWLADWHTIAEKTAHSGFDKRRITAGAREETPLPVPCGIWIGTSPFAAPLRFEEGETPVFPLREETDLWINTAGLLRANKKAWIFTARE